MRRNRAFVAGVQLEMFDTNPEPVAGRTVHLNTPCRCGFWASILAADKEARRYAIQCPKCRRRRGWLTDKSRKFLNRSIDLFGAPVDVAFRSRGTKTTGTCR